MKKNVLFSVLLVCLVGFLFLTGCVKTVNTTEGAELAEENIDVEMEVVPEGVEEEGGAIAGQAIKETPVYINCTDSDYQDYFNKGKVTYSYTFKGVAHNNKVLTDKCTGSNKQFLLEYYCNSNNNPVSITKKCEAGCVDGACVLPPECVDFLPYCNGDVLVNQTGNNCTGLNSSSEINCATYPWIDQATCYVSKKQSYYGENKVYAECLKCGWAVCEKDNKVWMESSGVCETGWKLVTIVDGPNCN